MNNNEKYEKLKSYFEEYVEINKEGLPPLYELYPQLVISDELSVEKRNRLHGVMLGVLSKEFRYPEAEEVVASIEDDNLPWQTGYALGKFYINTRRYDIAEYFIKKTIEKTTDAYAIGQLEELLKENSARCEGTKKEYLPQKAEAREKYETAMKAIGMDVTIPACTPKPMKEEEYPSFEEKTEADFNSFVAYDFETTGFCKNGFNKKDSIIEVGAIKVVDGKIVETKEFTFQELVKPYKTVVSSKVTEVTGITADDVKDARRMWEVIPDFMSFVGDSVMVGFNNVNFDAAFLRRAGRYCNTVYTNKQFDVKRYLDKIKNKIGYAGENEKLETVSKYYGIENPQAHRALADAVTTSKVFLKLKELDQ